MLLAAAIIGLQAQLPQNRSGLYAELQTDSIDSGEQTDIRVNPVMDEPSFAEEPERVDYASYPFIEAGKNRIDLNGADWCALRTVMEGASDGSRVSVVHIGDSHIQADGATEVTRRLLQSRYGDAGRGFIAPLKLAGTNEPLNYRFTSTSSFRSARLMKTPWDSEMQFSGVSLTPLSRDFNFTVSTETSRHPADPFRIIRIYYEGGEVKADSVVSCGEPVAYVTKSVMGMTEIFLSRQVSEVTLQLSADTPVAIAGIELFNARPGIVYTAIGNNGAAFSSYAGLNVGQRISEMNPSLVVLSMGTNEAFGSMSESAFYDSIDRMVADIKAHNPGAQLLLVTPQECHRRTRRGKRRSGTFSVNTKVKRMRDVIVRYGEENSVPVYDYYTVAGGSGSTAKWVKNNLFGRDHIHLSWKGYALMGQLLADAITGALDSAECDHLN